MPFEIIFITEGLGCTPAAEIQYRGQRLCIVRLGRDAPELEFGLNGYVGQSTIESVPLEEFVVTLGIAKEDLRAWTERLPHSGSEA